MSGNIPATVVEFASIAYARSTPSSSRSKARGSSLPAGGNDPASAFAIRLVGFRLASHLNPRKRRTRKISERSKFETKGARPGSRSIGLRRRALVFDGFAIRASERRNEIPRIFTLRVPGSSRTILSNRRTEKPSYVHQ